ncbi:two-component system alkaline phosphatase synthesis response regulator PhoP [Scopulibacillus darangshiensis]|uniref:Two-component system alkaline phosphatase synthesis response regulator PhoP n=1 Tax=Scopulibacillus darangshiensis TaxID=442528 RepID=A0A4R2PAV7_9BACL|nr:response regulator transcription factor [Scopulibacillus darangshiensis]TCP32097.1 two-component system alkaline phosphatase synthesis response regulator PhoP [Scopulibacillus darangshiensis]
MPNRILVVDDEPSIVTLLSFNLEKAGFEVLTAETGTDALQKTKDNRLDLIVLDLMLPEMDGIDVCRKLREEGILVPILMLTAKDDELDKILGLELGADDYMTKPFSPREVVARVKAILRRSHHADAMAQQRLSVGDITVFPENYEAIFKGKQMTLTPKEFELLLYLVQHLGKVLTREQLLNAVWHYDFAGDTRIVDVHVSHLREKIEADTRKPQYIKTVRGLGYKLEEPANDVKSL